MSDTWSLPPKIERVLPRGGELPMEPTNPRFRKIGNDGKNLPDQYWDGDPSEFDDEPKELDFG